MFVMKNYKVVGVYSGYGEMSIEGIDEELKFSVVKSELSGIN